MKKKRFIPSALACVEKNWAPTFRRRPPRQLDQLKHEPGGRGHDRRSEAGTGVSRYSSIQVRPHVYLSASTNVWVAQNLKLFILFVFMFSMLFLTSFHVCTSLGLPYTSDASQNCNCLGHFGEWSNLLSCCPRSPDNFGFCHWHLCLF